MRRTHRTAPAGARRSSRRERPAVGEVRAAGGRPVVLLGPQTEPTLEGVVAELESRRALPAGVPVATITAGWREREGEAELVPLGARPWVDLGLYGRAEALAAADPELAEAHSETQRRLKLLRRAYNVRLACLVTSLVELEDLDGDHPLLAEERAAALAMLRELDRRHLERVAEIRAAYEERIRPAERDQVARAREDIARALAGAGAVAIAGGHVATLLNRLRDFGIAELIRSRPLIAWSAGAMALAARVLLFHDRPPWGPGNAEVFDHGLGLIGGLALLPHATRRLALDDAVRTGRLARRLAPEVAVLLDPGARLELRGATWVGHAVRRLDPSGRPVPLEELEA